jgi:hypothetical protein
MSHAASIPSTAGLSQANVLYMGDRRRLWGEIAAREGGLRARRRTVQNAEIEYRRWRATLEFRRLFGIFE